MKTTLGNDQIVIAQPSKKAAFICKAFYETTFGLHATPRRLATGEPSHLVNCAAFNPCRDDAMLQTLAHTAKAGPAGPTIKIAKIPHNVGSSANHENVDHQMKRVPRISLTPDLRAALDAHARPNRPSRNAHVDWRPPLIVAGMHRSGTSFVASLLKAAGLDVGHRLMPAARGNERGHFENLDFVDFHMRWLRLTGHHESGWAATHPLVLPEDAVAEAEEIIDGNARDMSWGWKDPRTTLFLDFWATIIPAANYLFVYREPTEVINSLFRRGDETIKLTPQLAAQSYLSHNAIIRTFAAANRTRCIVANVSTIAADPTTFLARLGRRFGLELDSEVASPFDEQLMHKIDRHSPWSTLLRQLVPNIEHEYQELEALADFPSSRSESGPVTGAATRSALFQNWIDVTQREEDTEARLAEMTSRIAMLDAEIVTQQSELNNLRSTLTTVQDESAGRAEELNIRWAEIDQLSSQLSEVKSDSTARSEQLGARESHISNLESKLSEAQSELLARKNELRQRQDDLVELQQHLTATQAEIAARSGELAAVQAERENLFAQLAHESAVSNERAEQLAVREGHISSLESQLSEAQSELLARRNELDSRKVEIEELIGQLSQESADRTALIAAQAEIAARSGELAAIQAERENLLALLAHENAVSQDQAEQLAARDAEIAQLREHLSRVQTENVARREEFDAKLAEANKQIATGTNGLDARKTEIDRLQLELAGSQTEVAARLEQLHEQAQENASLRVALSRAKSDIATQLDTLRHRESEVNRLMQQLLDERNAATAETQSLTAEIEALSAAFEGLQNRLNHSLREIALGNEAVETLRAAVVDRDATLEEVRSQLDNARKLHRANRSLSMALRHRVAEAYGEADDLRRELSGLATTVRMRESEIEAVSKELRQSRARLFEAHEATNVAQVNISSLEQQVEDRSAQLDASNTELAASRATANQLDSSTSAVSRELSDALVQLSERDERLQKAHADLANADNRATELELQLNLANQRFVEQTEKLLLETRRESEALAQLISTVQSSHFWRLKRTVSRLLSPILNRSRKEHR